MSTNDESNNGKRKSVKGVSKGFGKSNKKTPEPNVTAPQAIETTSTPTSTTITTNVEDITTITNPDDLILRTDLFKRKESRREDNLVDMKRRLKEEEDLISTDPSVGAVPEVVADRMIGRIAAFFGIPVFGGLGIFVAAYFYSKKYDMVIPPMILAYVTQVPFVLGLVGITYAILSSSWDPETPGSVLGIEEFKLNFQRIQEGLSRTRETAELRDEIEKESKTLKERKRT
eukprot:CAMPEP_0170061670 /NCGR_PEP_ID=MMETSP0019_2-20121128/3159_1 /TAXON_ID=98059 /ORGANISM="Dinobryon sp., Strain UTEXLB2267" /LENGTH=229 /DNA_ID=CAMNT_0010267575 /DNA_START=82 /DNA_END=771 /DNA_ORIENTATION=-